MKIYVSLFFYHYLTNLSGLVLRDNVDKIPNGKILSWSRLMINFHCPFLSFFIIRLLNCYFALLFSLEHV